MNYPSHIYEPIRREIAISYMVHEFRKYLPSLHEQQQWLSIHKDMETWFDSGKLLYPVRDFWNGFHGIAMGFKLVIHLTAFLTAKNVKWERRFLNILDLDHPHATDHITADMVQDDPIIVTQKLIDGQRTLSIYDGNTRVSWAKRQGKTEIEAYVSLFTDERNFLSNYWIPTSILMELVSFANKAYERQDTQTYKGYVSILKDLMAYSQSAQYELTHRAFTKDGEFKKMFLQDILHIT